MAGNSWEQPVANEPSLGTWHPIATDTSGWKLTQVTVAGTWYDIQFTEAPVGAKAIIAFVSNGTALLANIYTRPKGSAWAQAPQRTVLTTTPQYNGAQVIFVLDSNRTAQIAANAIITLYAAYPCYYSI